MYFWKFIKISRTSPTSQPEAHRCIQKGAFFMNYKTPKFLEKSPLLGAKKHSQDKGTSCHQNVTTNIPAIGVWDSIGIIAARAFVTATRHKNS
jgi:hypothetical protein